MKTLLLTTFLTLSSSLSFAIDNFTIGETGTATIHVKYELIGNSIKRITENGEDGNFRYFEYQWQFTEPKISYYHTSAVLFFCDSRLQYSPYTSLNVFPGVVYENYLLEEGSSLVPTWEYVCSRENVPTMDFSAVTPRLKQILKENAETAKRVLRERKGN